MYKSEQRYINENLLNRVVRLTDCLDMTVVIVD